MQAIVDGDLAELNRAVKAGFKLYRNDNEPLLVAAENGHLNIVKRILQDQKVDPVDQDNAAIRVAYYNGHNDVVFELAKNPFVREELFDSCKDELTLDEAKFLLYFHEEIEDADVLLRNFVEEEDLSFVPESDESEEISSSEEFSSEDYSDY